MFRRVYISPTAQISSEDSFELSLPVVGEGFQVDPLSFVVKFKNFAVEQTNVLKYKKHLNMLGSHYDAARCCDLETFVNSWKSPTKNIYRSGISKLIEYLTKFMELVDEKYEFYRFFTFRLEFKALKTGTISQTNFTGMNIQIKEQTEQITRILKSQAELTKVEKIELRVGDTFVLYLTDLPS